MGKPYRAELDQLTNTYSWATTCDPSECVAAVTSSVRSPLLASGSGGSLTVAHFAAFLHQKYALRIAKAVTPFELVQASPHLRDVAVWLFSASGRNVDILDAFSAAADGEPSQLVVMCCIPSSPLAHRTHAYHTSRLVTAATPSGRDGFLATNSLLASTILLARAYTEALEIGEQLPTSLRELAEPIGAADWHSGALGHACKVLWERDTLVVLHGAATHAAALDIESKFTEAALGHVQVADYRNFGHGRHHWLAKHGSTSGVLALITDDDRDLAERMLRHLPDGVPIVRLDTRSRGIRAAITSLLSSLYVAGLAGEARGIDPGRPGVPTFGSKLYHLGGLAPRGKQEHDSQASRHRLVAIARKFGFGADSPAWGSQLKIWEKSYADFLGGLASARFSALVLDYDGTLCDGMRRTQAQLGPDVRRELERLLERGIWVGVATGRGKSAREALRATVARELWGRVIVGYYNGAEVASLTDSNAPNGAPVAGASLAPIADAIGRDLHLAALARLEPRPAQLTLTPNFPEQIPLIWDRAWELARSMALGNIEVLSSSHSVDILASGVSKLAVVRYIREVVAVADTPTLCIGDRGKWPGNDYGLLSEAHSLSVDEVSSDPKTCWNMSPVGCRGVDATIAYLQALEVEESLCYMRIEKLFA